MSKVIGKFTIEIELHKEQYGPYDSPNGYEPAVDIAVIRKVEVKSSVVDGKSTGLILEDFENDGWYGIDPDELVSSAIKQAVIDEKEKGGHDAP